MSSPFVAEIRMFGCNFAPTGWAQCNGQLLPLSQNTALFSLLGTFYGGDGKSTFALPNLQGGLATHQGQGPGLQEWFLGQMQGSDSVTLLQSEMPAHTHSLVAKTGPAAGVNPSNALIGNGAWTSGTSFGAITTYSTDTSSLSQMNPQTLGVAGADLPHNNLMPYCVVNYCIALQGVFPPRT
jgi:microcystin-dependent protein